MKRKIAGLSLLLLPVVTACAPDRTYAEGCGRLPQGWITPRQGRGVLSIVNVVSVKADATLIWNGAAVTEPVLRSYLERTAELTPLPVTQIKFDPTVDCETVRWLRQMMAETLDCSYGLCAEGSGKWWFIGDVVGPGISREPFEWDAPPPPGDQLR